MITEINDLAEYFAALSKYNLKKNHIRFFRGHPDYAKNKIKPHIYRSFYLISNEESIIREAIIRCPSDFSGTLSFFEHLVKLQHYGLPTRLLDLTSNALVALYFACREKEKTTGEIIVFDVPQDDVKYYNSDTVSVISNIARRPSSFDLDELPEEIKKFNKDDEIGRLLHDIKEDKPAFRSIINPKDLERVICVKAKLDNARIARQDGAFFVFGIKRKKKRCAIVPEDWITCGTDENRIIFSSKYKIKKQLEQFGISEQTLFPELEYQTKSIVMRFKGKYKRGIKLKRRK
jgi:hypothetical protein